MLNETIKTYVATQRAAGHDDASIMAALQQSGWQQSDISEALQVPASSVPTPTPATAPDQGEFPPELHHWNWGAFLLSWIWGVSHQAWISLLCFVPFVNIVMPFYLGAKGNELAWKNRRFKSIEDFKAVQHAWAVGGLIFILIQAAIIAFIVFSLIIPLIENKSDYIYTDYPASTSSATTSPSDTPTPTLQVQG